jgi:hypothetical protein
MDKIPTWTYCRRMDGVISNRNAVVVAVAIVVAMVGALMAINELGVFEPSAAENAAVLADETYEELVSELELTASSVSIPADWEVEFAFPDSVMVNAAPGGIGYQASSDLSSSGTWMLISVTPFTALDGGHSPDERFWQFTERHIAGGSESFVQEPVAITVSGLDGYSYEMAGGKGAKTGRELGGFFAILFGDEYTYQVIIQFYVPDRSDMKVLFRDTLAGLALTSDDDYI